MNPQSTFDESGWTGSTQILSRAGLVLTNVAHDGYNLARSIRVFRIWLNPGTRDERLLHLGTDDFELVEGPVARGARDRAPEQFGSYHTVFGLRARWISRVREGDAILGAHGEPARLTIEQTYLFTDYHHDPPHEPGGVLDAARLFPLVRFSTTNPSIKSIRVDYCLNMSLDALVGGRVDPALAVSRELPRAERFALQYRWNVAGVFRDVERISQGLFSLRGPLGAQLGDFFESAEKPLQREIVGRGLVRGRAFDEGEEPTTWDNIHQWGTTSSKRLPSTPGAFHAAHLHWRWGTLFSSPSWFDRFAIFAGQVIGDVPPGGKLGDKVFEGDPETAYGTFTDTIAGGLVDPKIPYQNLSFAVTKSDLFPAIERDRRSSFAALFEARRSRPADISLGDDLLTWIAFEAEPTYETQRTGARFEGTFFVHGLFFAHGLELELGKTTRTQGVKSPEGRVAAVWARPPTAEYYR